MNLISFRSVVKVFVFCFFMMSLPVFAQQGNISRADNAISEVSLGYGNGTPYQFDDFVSNFAAPFLGYKYRSFGVFHAGYSYGISNKIDLGLTLLYSRGQQKYNGIKYSDIDHFGVLVEGRYNYVDSPNLRLYSGAGVGFNFSTERFVDSDKENFAPTDFKKFSYQLTGFGAKFGNKFGGFGEIGFGFKGLVSVGIFTRF